MKPTIYRSCYNRLILPALWGGSRVLSLFLPKVALGLKGREGLAARVREFRSRIGNKPVLLFHCASAGELEALKPLAKEFDRNSVALVVSYFSPSARSAVAKSDEFDYADYSPVDSPQAVREYLDALRPSVVAITKHDIWPAFVWEVRDRGLPIFLINGNFHTKSLRQWPLVRQFHASVYKGFDEILAVSEDDATQARRIVGDSTLVSVGGDSRFDRVLSRVDRRAELPEGIESFCAGHPALIAGSTHADDEQLLLPVLAKLSKSVPDWRAVIVPHDPSPKARARIADLAMQYGLKVRDLDSKSSAAEARILLVNRTGVLADMYRTGRAAYVGGGFGKGVHSVLEPMAAGLPVACGPNIVVSNEARNAQKDGTVVVVTGRNQLEEWLIAQIGAANQAAELGPRARQFVTSQSGVARRIAERLREALRGGA